MEGRIFSLSVQQELACPDILMHNVFTYTLTLICVDLEAFTVKQINNINFILLKHTNPIIHYRKLLRLESSGAQIAPCATPVCNIRTDCLLHGPNF